MTTHLENLEWKCTSEAHFGTGNEIHIWRIPSSPVQESELDILSFSEIKRLAEFKNINSKRVFFSSRIAMRKLFSSYLDLTTSEIVIEKHPQGKPYIKQEKKVFEFNLTHSDNQILLAVSNNREVGIDIEASRQIANWHDIAKKIFDQKTFLSLTQVENPELKFIDYWTAFESRQKLLGLGVFGRSPLKLNLINTISFSPARGFTAALTFLATHPSPDIKFLEYVNS